MAKKEKAVEKEAETEKESAPTFKYGVTELAEMLELEPASVRVKLRNNDVEKAGKSYGWNTKKELEEIAELIKTSKPKASKKDDDEPDEKPAKKSKSKAK